jgi:hypothetical protein
MIKGIVRCGLAWGKGASQGEESVLADSGQAGEIAARVGRVRSLAFLSILREARWASLQQFLCAIAFFLTLPHQLGQTPTDIQRIFLA